MRFNIIDFLFTFIILLCREHFAHIIDLDKVTERDRPPFLNITESQLPSIKLPKSVEQQLDYYLAETTIEKIWESFESYKIVNSDDELYTRKSRGSLVSAVSMISLYEEPKLFLTNDAK